MSDWRSERWEAECVPDPSLWVVTAGEKSADDDWANVVTCVTSPDDEEAKAKQIASDHNACLGIESPETTVPELVMAAVRLADEYEELEPGHCPNLETLRALLAKTGKS